MTATIDVADGAQGGEVPGSEASAGYGLPAWPAAGRAVIAIELLTAHPGNVRRDIHLDEEFLGSIAELGVLTPLRVTPDGEGYRVIEGHRRLAAAERLGLTEVPCDLAAEREGDEAGQFLDMYATNHHRRGLSTLEEADALFAARASGASKTRIRRATGLSRDDVALALRAGRMTGFAREVAAGFGHAVTLEQVALLAEFEDDTEAVSRIMTEMCNGRTGQHAAEEIRQERAEAAEHERLLAQLIADGYAIGDELPPNAFMLHALLHDGQELTPEAHAACPGRAVYFGQYHSVYYYCTAPEANGHASRFQPTPLPDLRGDATEDGGTESGEAEPEAGTGPGATRAPDPHRRLVIEGNRAWAASGNVRKRWLGGSLLARRTAPREAMPFITSQLLTMPAAIRDAITHAARSSYFTEITGGTIKRDETGAWPAARLPVAILALIAACYEERMDGDAERETWRTDRTYPRCPRDDAGAYFRFLASAGYELSPIELAVASGVPYTGDQPDEDETTAGEPDGPQADPAGAGDDDGTGSELAKREPAEAAAPEPV